MEKIKIGHMKWVVGAVVSLVVWVILSMVNPVSVLIILLLKFMVAVGIGFGATLRVFD